MKFPPWLFSGTTHCNKKKVLNSFSNDLLKQNVLTSLLFYYEFPVI